MGAGPHIGLELLGGFRLTVERRREPVPAASQRVLAFLALHPAPQPRLFVAGTLWPDVTERRATGSLRAALWRLPEIDGLLDAGTTHVGLGEQVAVDVHRAVEHTRRALHGDATAELGELRRPLLPGCDDEWIEPEHERLRQLTLHAVEARARHHVEHGEAARAIDLCLQITAAEPLRESAHRGLVRAHLVLGNHHEAVAVYDAFRQRLASALGLPPSPLMERLIGPLLAIPA